MFIRDDGGESWLCTGMGGVGSVLGRFFEAALGSAMEGSREAMTDLEAGLGADEDDLDRVGDGGEVAGCDGGSDCRPSR